MVDLSTKLKDLELKNPVLTASGTFGYGDEYADFINLEALGGFVVKGTTLEPRQGNDYPRMAETPMGMLNCVGLQNGGVELFVAEKWPALRNLDTVPIVNVSGARVEDYVACAEHLASLDGLKAIELNISCPNVKQGGMAFGTTTAGAASVVEAVRRVWPRHLMVKLSPNVTSIVDIARAVEDAGADSVSLINTLLGMAVDVERRRPVLSTVTGGLSGPAVKPVARAYGVAGCACRKYSRSRPWRYIVRQRCPRVYNGGCECHTGRYGQFCQSSRDSRYYRGS